MVSPFLVSMPSRFQNKQNVTETNTTAVKRKLRLRKQCFRSKHLILFHLATTSCQFIIRTTIVGRRGGGEMNKLKSVINI